MQPLPIENKNVTRRKQSLSTSFIFWYGLPILFVYMFWMLFIHLIISWITQELVGRQSCLLTFRVLYLFFLSLICAQIIILWSLGLILRLDVLIILKICWCRAGLPNLGIYPKILDIFEGDFSWEFFLGFIFLKKSLGYILGIIKTAL